MGQSFDHSVLFDLAQNSEFLYHFAGGCFYYSNMPPSQVAPQTPIAHNLVPYNFVDLEEKATNYLAQVRAGAAQIVADAQNEVERIRQTAAAEWKKSAAEIEQTRSKAKEETETIRRQLDELRHRLQEEEENFKNRKEQLEGEAIKLKTQLKQNEDIARKNGYDEGKKVGHDEGHSQGYADGEMKAMIDYAEKVQREAEIQLGAKLETLLPALKTMIERLDVAKQSFLQQWERSALKVAEAIAARAIDRQLPEMVDVPLRLLKESLELSTGSTSMRIRLNKDDYEALQPQIDLLIQEMTRSVQTEIICDTSVSPGGCILETPQGTIDNRIETRLMRIQEELCLVEEEYAGSMPVPSS